MGEEIGGWGRGRWVILFLYVREFQELIRLITINVQQQQTG